MSQGNYGGYTPSNPNNPYANPGSFGQAPPKKKSKLGLILGIIGGVGVVICLLCCGGGYLLFNAGMNVIGDQVKTQVQGHPAIQEHIGTIETSSMDFPASLKESEKHGGGGNNRFVVHIKGSKGSGDIVGKQRPGQQSLSEKVLRLPDGKELPLD